MQQYRVVSDVMNANSFRAVVVIYWQGQFIYAQNVQSSISATW